MPRIARIIAPGFPHHVTQRGNNKSTVFFDDEDKANYLEILRKMAKKHDFDIWAYCLMDNHVHLLAVPQSKDSLSKGIGSTNLIYTQYLNRKRGSSGRIWQNRFFSCIVQNDFHLWAVAVYIENNPVKGGLVEEAPDYKWSSAKAHFYGDADENLGRQWLADSEREGYRNLFKKDAHAQEEAIRKRTSSGRPFGDSDFISRMENFLGCVLRNKRPGRPWKNNMGSVPN